MVVSSFSCSGISTGDLNPVYNVPMLGTHKPVVATADNAASSLRSGRLFPAVPHFLTFNNNEDSSDILLPCVSDWIMWRG
jgi:hypothetical protein